MKRVKAENHAFTWESICILAPKAGMANDMYHDYWESIAARIDEYSRIECSKEWHKNASSTLRSSIDEYTRQMESAIKVLKSEDADYRINDDGGVEIPLDDILTHPLMIKYRSVELPLCDPADFLEGDADDEETYALAADRAEAEKYKTSVPSLPVDEVERLAMAKSAKELLEDKPFLALAKAVLADKTHELTGNAEMRLHEYDLREELEEKMVALCDLSAVRAKEVGDEALARRFVEAAHRLRYQIRHWWHGEMSETNAQYIAATILNSFDELQCAIAVRRLPKWKKGR